MYSPEELNEFGEVVGSEIIRENNFMTLSPKGALIWADVKSWAVTTTLTLLPIALGLLYQVVSMHELGVWKETVLLAIGALLKLAQKWSQVTSYVATPTA
jgi:hypothetical protein